MDKASYLLRVRIYARISQLTASQNRYCITRGVHIRDDRDILAPLDTFRQYSSEPKVYEDILSEHDVDDIIDWILKSYTGRRPNRASENSHWSEKDIVFFLTHDYKFFIKTYWNILKNVIPFLFLYFPLTISAKIFFL